MKGAEGRCQREGAWNARRRGGKGSRSLRGRDTAERDAALFFLVRVLARGCSLAGSILLGRELDPASFGLVSLVGAALSVPEAIGTLGLPDALAAAPRRDAGRERELAGTAFWWMLLGETGMAVLLLILAPFFARALHRENLTSLLRLSSLSLFATPWIRTISVQVQRRRQEEQAEPEGREKEAGSCREQGEGGEEGKRDVREGGRQGERDGASPCGRGRVLQGEGGGRREKREGEQRKPWDRKEDRIKNGKKTASLYRRYLLSTLPGTLPTPVCALWLWHRGRDLNPGAVTPSAAEGALLLVLLTLTRKLLDAVLGAAGTGWRPFAGKRQSRTKVPERESYRERPKSRENRKEPDCQKKWQSQEGRQSPKKRKTVGKPENTGIRQHGKRWEGQERQRSPLLWSPLLWNPLLWDPDLPCLLRDGRNLLLASLLDIACGNLRVFLIGISCSGTELAFYTRGRQIPELLAEDLACSLSFVLLPLFSAERKTVGGKKEKPDPAGAVWVEEQKTAGSGTKEPGAAKSRNGKRHRTKAGRWKEQTPAGSTEGRKESSQSSPAGAVLLAGIKKASLAAFPAMAVLAGTAGRLVPAVFGDRWSGMSFYLTLACIRCALYPIHALNGAAIRGIGETGLFFCLEAGKKALSILLLLPALFSPGGQAASVLAITDLVSSLLALPINAAPLKMRIGVGIREELQALCPALLLSLFLGGSLSLLSGRVL